MAKAIKAESQTRAQLPEVFCSQRSKIIVQLKHNPPRRQPVDGDIHEHLRSILLSQEEASLRHIEEGPRRPSHEGASDGALLVGPRAATRRGATPGPRVALLTVSCGDGASELLAGLAAPICCLGGVAGWLLHEESLILRVLLDIARVRLVLKPGDDLGLGEGLGGRPQYTRRPRDVLAGVEDIGTSQRGWWLPFQPALLVLPVTPTTC
eukprot:scaffold2404_cov398-Prasinococcus_capsulatus_cf.AAC.38